MICNGKLYSAWIATKSGVNPTAIRNEKTGKIVFSFVNEDRMFELRRQVEQMDNEDIKKEVDPAVFSYLTDLIEIENRNKKLLEENKKRIKELGEELEKIHKGNLNFEIPKGSFPWENIKNIEWR